MHELQATGIVTVRMRKDETDALAEVQRQLGGSRSDAVRQAVQIVAGALADAPSIKATDRALRKRLTARVPVEVNADPTALEGIRDGLREVAERYSAQTFEFQKIGNDWNWIVRIAEADGTVDPDALAAIRRALERLASAMERDAKRDAGLATTLGELF